MSGTLSSPVYPGYNNSIDLFAARYDATGSMLWGRAVPGAAVEFGGSVVRTGAAAYLAGYNQITDPSVDVSVVLAKVTLNGAEL